MYCMREIIIVIIIIVISIIVISIIINSIITITTMVCSLFNYVLLLSRSISSISHSILQLPINRQHTLLVNSITLFSIFVTYAAYNSPDTATHLSISIDVTTKNLGSERFQPQTVQTQDVKEILIWAAFGPNKESPLIKIQLEASRLSGRGREGGHQPPRSCLFP